jgi:hypothetical protein
MGADGGQKEIWANALPNFFGNFLAVSLEASRDHALKAVGFLRGPAPTDLVHRE